MKTKQLHIWAGFLVTFVALHLFLISTGKASAASFKTSGPTSVTESTAGGEYHSESYDGPLVKVGNPVELVVTADTSVSEENFSYIFFTYNASGDCGFIGGKGLPYLAKSGFSQQIKLHKDDAPHTSTVKVYPIYNPDYTGTRTCTVSFSIKEKESSLNEEVVSKYGGLKIPSKTFSILDAQSAPESTPTTSTAPPEDSSTKKPAAPTAKLVNAEGNEIQRTEGEDKPKYTSNDPIIMTGITVPNGKVKLFIFSEPQEATVTADEKGDWSYTITSIEPGDHRVEIEVTDPDTGETSDREQVLAFTVEANDTDETQPESVELDDEESSAPLLAGIAALVIIGGAAAGYYLWRKRSAKMKVAPVKDTAQPLSQPEKDDTDSTPQS